LKCLVFKETRDMKKTVKAEYLLPSLTVQPNRPHSFTGVVVVAVAVVCIILNFTTTSNFESRWFLPRVIRSVLHPRPHPLGFGRHAPVLAATVEASSLPEPQATAYPPPPLPRARLQASEGRSLADPFPSGGLPETATYTYLVLAIPVAIGVVLLLATAGSSANRISDGLRDEQLQRVRDRARDERLSRLYPKAPPKDPEAEASLAVEEGTATKPEGPTATAEPPPAGAPPAPDPATLEAQFQEELKRRASGGEFPTDPPRRRRPAASDPEDSDDLQGLPRRLVNLARFGATFWFGLWPLAIGTVAAVLATSAIFGSSFIHLGTKPKPVAFDPETGAPLGYESRAAPATRPSSSPGTIAPDP